MKTDVERDKERWIEDLIVENNMMFLLLEKTYRHNPLYDEENLSDQFYKIESKRESRRGFP